MTSPEMGEHGVHEVEPSTPPAEVGFLGVAVQRVRRFFNLYPGGAEPFMSEHFGHAEKRNEHKPELVSVKG